MFKFICKYCNESFEFSTKQAFGGHSGRCSKNPNSQTPDQISCQLKKFYDEKRKLKIDEYLKSPTLCLTCNKIVDYFKRTQSFCSRSCSATYHNLKRPPKTKETKEKISNGIKRWYNTIGYTPDQLLKRKVIAKKIGEQNKEKAKIKLLNEDFNTLKFERLRSRVIYEQDKKCKTCNRSHWMRRPIIFELNHIDGNNKNNIRENLEALCPNCHSLTDTWRGRNKNSGKPFGQKRITDDVLLICLMKNNWNMRQSLLELNYAAKGGNYKRCHKLKREYEELIQKSNIPIV